MGDVRVVHQPGEGYHYASKGYMLLELAIEEVTGEAFADYMRREILEPLGMLSSNYGWTPELRARAAVGHDWGNHPCRITSMQRGPRGPYSRPSLIWPVLSPPRCPGQRANRLGAVC